MEAVLSIFLVVCLAMGWLFNLIVIVTFLWNGMPISRGLAFVSLIVPFGAWLFCVGVLIGAGLLALLRPGEYST